MTVMSFNDLPGAVFELTQKVDELYSIVKNVEPREQADQYLTVEEAAEFLSLSIPTIYSKVSKRELPYMKRGKRLYFSREALESYLDDGRVKTIKQVEGEAERFLSTQRKGKGA